MSSRKITDLEFGIRKKVKGMIAELARNGVDLLIYCTYRSPEEQARLYRKSRNLRQIELKAKKFRDRDLGVFADILMNVGPQKGKLGWHVTFAGPGESWHQYCQAFDAVPMINGKCGWSTEIYGEQWKLYGKIAKKHGFYWAGDWKDFEEYPHCQAMPGSNPLKMLDHEMIFKMILGPGQTGLFNK